MYYIVEGYRDTFIRHVWFFDRYNQTIYFWGITLFILIIGIVIFKKLKPHFQMYYKRRGSYERYRYKN